MSDIDKIDASLDDNHDYRPSHAIDDRFDHPLSSTTETTIDLSVHTHINHIDIHNPRARNTMSTAIRDLLATRWIQRSSKPSPPVDNAVGNTSPSIVFHVATWEINRRTGDVELHVTVEPVYDPTVTIDELLAELRLTVDKLTAEGFTVAVNMVVDHQPSSTRLTTIFASQATFHTLRPTSTLSE